MNRELLDRLVNAVLYEGYILYPYRASSKKNQRERFTFGRVYPNDYAVAQKGAEPSSMQTECLLQNDSNDPVLEVTVRFLQPSAREIARATGAGASSAEGATFEVLPELTIGDRVYQTWLEAIEREVTLPALALNQPAKESRDFEFSASRTLEPIEGDASVVILRRNDCVRGRIDLKVEPAEEGIVKVTLSVSNQTPVPSDKINQQNEVIMRTFASTHTILHARGGRFVSLLDPDPAQIERAKECRNIGTWPVLVGDEGKGERDTMLSSPIILYDYPKIAAESAGDLFDSTEIDEILTLRVKTMTDREKLEMRQVDEHARRILERAENLSAENFMQMHGTMRNVTSLGQDFFNPVKPVETATVDGISLRKGDRVRIRPKKRADVMDMALSGRIAIIEAVEQDVDDQIHFALILEDDPGKDLGFMRQPGHRFFYGADEVEPLRE